MKAKHRGGFAASVAAVVLAGVVVLSCGQAPTVDGDMGGLGGLHGGAGNECATPNEGCPCSQPGEVVDCGKVVHRGPGGFVACSMGHRTCVGSSWGTCVGETDVTTQSVATKGLVAGGGLQPLGLGPSQVCPANGPYSNPCDPYCNYFLDNTDGGIDGGGTVTVNDAGAITINPEGGLVSGGGFSAPQAGVSGCSPNRNIVGASGTDCTASPLTTCQQDFRCDPTSKQCLWNGNTGYYDPTVAGVDLTIEAPCGPQGSANTTAVVCNRGSGTLAAGASITFFVSTGSSPPNSCTNLGSPNQTSTLSSALGKGQCTSFTLGNSTGAKFITVNAGLPGGGALAPAVTETAGLCANNSAYFRTDGGGGTCALCNSCVTTLTGTIYDPRGANPLPDVTVYVPTDPVSALPVGVACDTCSSLITGTPWSLGTTDYKGQFTINVPDTFTFPLIIQAGRWRRRLMISGIPSCTTVSLDTFCKTNTCKQYNASSGAYTACSGTGGAGDIGMTSGGNPTCSRLPGTQSEGDMPSMALVQAAGDQLECLVRKIGVADSEFTVAGGGGKVALFSHNGMKGPTGMTETAESALWGTTSANSTFNNYGAIIAPCDNNHTTYGSGVNPMAPPSNNVSQAPAASANATQQGNMKNYLEAGGHLFTTHWFTYDWLAANYPSAAVNQYGSNVDNDRDTTSPGGAFDFTIDTSTATGQTFSNWLNVNGASPGGVGTVRFDSWRHLPTTVGASTVRLAYGDSRLAPISHPQTTPATGSSVWGGPLVSIYQFDTPYGSASPCGRVDIAMSHVSQYWDGSSTAAFPPGQCGSASNAMTAQELAFEYLIFNSQACVGLVPTVAPPSSSSLPSVTYIRDYQGVCPAGTHVQWGVFYWQANIPGMSSIAFAASTADTEAALPSAPGTQPTATSRSIGTATTTVTSPAWNCNGCPTTPVTVDYQLQKATPTPNTPSLVWLRVFMTFNPDNSTNPPTAPQLTQWRQTYDCVPSE